MTAKNVVLSCITSSHSAEGVPSAKVSSTDSILCVSSIVVKMNEESRGRWF